MTSFSCSESSRSISAMRAFSIDSVSGRMTIAPSRISDTNFRMRSLPRSWATVSAPKRPCCAIWSSRLASADCAAAPPWTSASAFDIGRSLCFDFRLQAAQAVRIVNRCLQDFIEFVIALQTAAQVGQLLTQLEQLAQRLYLLRHAIRRKVIQALELEIDTDLARFAAQLVLDLECEMRRHLLQHIIEVVGRDLDKLPIAQTGQRIRGLTAEVSEHSHHERELLQLDGVARLNIVRDVNARWTYPLQFAMNTFSHVRTPAWGWARVSCFDFDYYGGAENSRGSSGADQGAGGAAAQRLRHRANPMHRRVAFLP